MSSKTRRHVRRATSIACCAALWIAFLLATAGVEGASASGAGATVVGSTVVRSTEWQVTAAARATAAGCSVAAPRRAHCYLSLLRAAHGPRPATGCRDVEAAGYSACNIQKAYKLTSLSASNGAAETVAVVDAYDDPNAEADLAVYRSANNLPACTSSNGCFDEVNQEGVTGGPAYR